MLKPIAWLVLLLPLVLQGAEYELTGVLQGQVLDKESGETLEGCNLQLLDSRLGAASDLDGRFRIEAVKVGVHNLRVSRLGYETRVVTDLVVTPRHSDEVVIELAPGAMELGEIVVRPDYFSVRDEGGAPAVRYNREEIRRAPGSAEDVSRLLHVHPAVAMGQDDQRNDLVVRGGNPIENLLTVDGHPVQNLSHFSNQGSTGGPVSILQADFIDDVRFVPGSFDSRFGNRLSSVMDVRMRRGSDGCMRGELYSSMAGIGFQAEGPLGKKGSFLLGGRRSYLELMVDQLNLANAPVMADLNGKVSFHPGPRDRVDVLLLGSSSRMLQSAVDDADQGVNFDTRVKNSMSGLSWRHFRKDGSSLTTRVTLNNQLFDETFSWYDSTERSDHSARENTLTLQSEWSRRFGASLWTIGAGAERLDSHHDVTLESWTTVFGEPIPPARVELDLDKVRSFGFLNLVHETGFGLQLTAGMRVDHDDWFGTTDLQPRVALRQQLFRDWAITGSAGEYAQTIPAGWAAQDERNRNAESMKVRQGQLGFEWRPADAWLLSLDGFHRSYRDMPYSRQQPWLPLAAAGSYFGYRDLGLILSGGEGRAYGLEFLAQKKLSGKTYGTFSYAWSLNRYRTPLGEWETGPFDRRHMATVILGWLPSNRLELSMKYAISGGAPTTPINETASAIAGRSRYDIARFNEDRLPVYHRLDLRADWRFHFRTLDLVTFLDLQNAYNQKNVTSRYWSVEDQQVKEQIGWEVMPVGGVRLEF